MSDVAIKIENLSKQYRLGLVSTGTLSHDLNRWWHLVRGKEDPYLKVSETNDRAHKGDSEYVWALKDISLEVKQGEVLGIIGKNGAGKSTLLKILSRVTAPTTGTIKYRGRIGSLLEVGTGFHPELTGKENIFLNGAILGMTKAEVQSKLDEIIDFSGVERYIDTPVKRYSSGMLVRLGFAVAAYLEPDILVVDEVLAVGDAEFQKKAIGKMKEVSGTQGRTVLFVSHNMNSIGKLCEQGLVLKNGSIQYYGETETAIQEYQNAYFGKTRTSWVAPESKANEIGAFNLVRFLLLTKEGILTRGVTEGDDLFVLIEFECKEIPTDLTIGISLFDDNGHYVYRTLHTDTDSEVYLYQRIGINRLKAKLETGFLKAGTYHVALDVSYHNSAWVANPFEETDRVLTFTKMQNKAFSAIHASAAIVEPYISWRFESDLATIRHGEEPALPKH